MSEIKSRGFTIVEVMLFLAISASLLTMAMMFMNGSISNARFNDATKSLESFISDQYTKIQTGSPMSELTNDSRPICYINGEIENGVGQLPAGTNPNCLVLGSALDFSDDGRSVNVYLVLGYAPPDYSALDSYQAMILANPRVWVPASGPVSVYDIGWQNSATTRRFVQMGNGASGNSRITEFKRIVFLRELNSERINIYFAKNTSDTIQLLVTNDGRLDTTSNARNVPALICVESEQYDQLRGRINIAGTGLGGGFALGSISSNMGSLDEVSFADVLPTDTGYTGVVCQ